LEGSSQEKAVQGVLNDVCMDSEGHTANLHRQKFGATCSPVSSTVCPFHLNDMIGVDADSKGFYEILSDNDDLQAGVIDCRSADVVVDHDVKFLQRKTEG
jgi:hypothetical protein